MVVPQSNVIICFPSPDNGDSLRNRSFKRKAVQKSFNLQSSSKPDSKSVCKCHCLDPLFIRVIKKKSTPGKGYINQKMNWNCPKSYNCFWEVFLATSGCQLIDLDLISLQFSVPVVAALVSLAPYLLTIPSL